MTSLISAVSWIPKGAALENPGKYVVDEEELERVQRLSNLKLDQAQLDLELAQDEEDEEWQDDDDEDGDEEESAEDEDEDVEMEMGQDEDSAALKKAKKAAKGIKEGAAKSKPAAEDGDAEVDVVAKYGLDGYDDEESKGAAMGAFSNVKGLTYYGNAQDDPFITLEAAQEDEEQEAEELRILPTDNLLVIAKTEDDVSQLEVYVYDDSADNLYVHHDLLLPAMPLCLEWLDYCPGSDGTKRGNYLAVGTMDPDIEIWSLDVVDAIFPDAILGNPEQSERNPAGVQAPAPVVPAVVDSATGKKGKKPKKPKKVKPVANDSYHVDAVLGLSWNKQHRNFLASCSADCTIKIWDLALPLASGALRSYNSVHSGKVQSVQWNPSEATVLLSGSYDGTVRVWDSRSPDGAVGTKVASDVECLRWNVWEEAQFLCSTEDGIVQAFDSRMLSSGDLSGSKGKGKAVWTLSAHDGPVSALDVNPLIKGCFVTGGTDGLVKLWNLDEKANGQRNISLVTSRDLDVGKVFAASFSPNDPTTIAVGGSGGNLNLWDASTNAGVRDVFGDRLRALGKSLEKKGDGVVGVIDDDSDVSDREAEE